MVALIISPEKLELIEKNINGEYELLGSNNIVDIVNKLKNVVHYSHIIIDIDYFDNSQEELLQNLYLLKISNSTPLIIIAQGKFKGDTFLSSLVEIGVYNFVLSFQPDIIFKELENCFMGIPFEDVEHFIIEENKNNSSFFNRLIKKKDKKTIKISVCGIMPRIGTTTQAIRLCKTLNILGHKTCYVEHNNSGHVQIIKDVFSHAEELKNMVTYSDVTMFYNDEKPREDEYNFIIYDIGPLELNNNDNDYDINIMVAGSTAWEFSKLADFLQEDKNNTIYIFSFTSENEREDISDFMQEAWLRTYYTSYCPDMFSKVTKDEKDMFKKMIL